MYLKESYVPDCLKVSLVVPVFKNVGEKSTAKNYHPVSLPLYINDLSMMLFVILLSMLMIVPATLNEIRHLICSNN